MFRSRPKKSPSAIKDDLAKLDSILTTLQEYQWKLDYFLYLLFRLEDDEGNAIDQSQKHLQIVVAVVNGSWNYTVADIVEEIYRNGVKFEYREDDESAKKYSSFSLKITTADIRHAQPGLHAWAVWSVTDLIQRESAKMIKYESGLHLRTAMQQKGATQGRREGETAARHPCPALEILEWFSCPEISL